MGNAERRKGVAGELEVAAIFREVGFTVNRTPNSGGLFIRGDIAGDVPAHVEVKRQETARPWAWMAQARSDAPGGSVPIVAFRRSRSDWLGLVPLEHLAAVLAVAGLAGGPPPREHELGLCRRALEQLAELELVLTGDPAGDHRDLLGRVRAIALEALRQLPPAADGELDPNPGP